MVYWSLPAFALMALLYLPRPAKPVSTGASVAIWLNWRSPPLWRLGLLLSGTSVLFMGTTMPIWPIS